MSDEYVHESSAVTEIPYAPGYTSFWPLTILVVGLILWAGYQSIEAYTQGSSLLSELKSAQTTIDAAQTAQSRLYAFAQDLIETANKDQYAAQIVKEANIRMNPNGSAAGTAPAPAQ
jgi:hypothetical protein